MQKTIYISTEGIWKSIKKAAAENNTSVSGYLVSLHLATIPGWDIPEEPAQKPEPQPDQSEDKKTEQKGKSNPARKKESEKAASKNTWVNPLGNSILAPKDQQSGKKVKK